MDNDTRGRIEDHARDLVGMPKYKKNLHLHGNKVYSYGTHVATIHPDKGEIHVHGHWSPTTSKHVNYVANEKRLKKVE